MVQINVSQVKDVVANLVIKANYYASSDIKECIANSAETDKHGMARMVSQIIVENYNVAAINQQPICQDTGMAVFFINIGQEVHIVGGGLTEAINEGVSEGYTRGYMRASVVKDPVDRKNTGDNTPAVIHYNIVPGDKLEIIAAPKGFGSENMSMLRMLTPSLGLQGIEDFIVEVVRTAGSNSCPPVVVGVGVGGTMEKAAIMAKQSLLRPIGSTHEDSAWKEVEKRVLERINALGIGPGGRGGDLTALGVHVTAYPTHIGGMPVCVDLGCHVTRYSKATLDGETVHYESRAISPNPDEVAPPVAGKKLTLPLNEADIAELKAGDIVLLNGPVYTMRDAGHKRLIEMIERGDELPFDFEGQIVYYAGPCPAKPGQVIGSVGPTTAGRMDKFSPALIENGLKLMLGKGERSEEVRQSIIKHGGVFFVAIGGVAAYMARCVKAVDLVAFEDLGTEAIRCLTVEDLPAIVAIDKLGNKAE